MMRKPIRIWLVIGIGITLLYLLPGKQVQAVGETAKEHFVQLRQRLITQFAGYQPKQWGQFIPGVHTRVHSEKKVIALTFDACGGPGRNGYDSTLINYLVAHHIYATLFMSSLWIHANPTIAQQLATNPLFEIENHGTFHRTCSLNGKSAYKLSSTKNSGEVIDEIAQNAKKIEQLTGRKPRYYRAAGDYYDEGCIQIANALGYQVVGFDVNGDGGATFSKKQTARALAKATPGSIVLFHMNKPYPLSETAKGVMLALSALEKKGYTFVKLSDYGVQ